MGLLRRLLELISGSPKHTHEWHWHTPKVGRSRVTGTVLGCRCGATHPDYRFRYDLQGDDVTVSLHRIARKDLTE